MRELESERMKDMKKTKVRGYRLWVMGLLLVSTGAMAQTFQTTVENNAIQSQQIINCGSSYSSTVYEPFSNTTPSEQSAVGASYSPARASGPRREKIDGGDTKPSEQSPIGDALLPLLLCAAGFAGVIALRRRRSVKE